MRHKGRNETRMSKRKIQKSERVREAGGSLKQHELTRRCHVATFLKNEAMQPFGCYDQPTQQHLHYLISLNLWMPHVWLINESKSATCKKNLEKPRKSNSRQVRRGHGRPMDNGSTDGNQQQVVFVHNGRPRLATSKIVFRKEKKGICTTNIKWGCPSMSPVVQREYGHPYHEKV